ncbi:MAG: hypothetical protein WCK32_01910 [Chlorobiaceae bacterium]
MEYFIRHTKVIEISENGFKELYDEQMIGIHYSSHYNIDRKELLDPEAYKEKTAKQALRCLIELGKNGGYVWSDYSPISKSVIGKIEPNTEVQLIDFEVDPEKNNTNCRDGKVTMKCLRLSDKRNIEEDEFLALKARRPQQGTFVHWEKSYGKIRKIFNEDFSISSLSDLTPDQQEILVYEYLSHAESNKCHIQHLLMPIGRTMKDIDIYGVNKSGQKVFVQVTYSEKDKTKIEALRKYKGKDNLLVYAGDVKNQEEDGIIFLNCETIYTWMHENTKIISFMEKS